MRNQLFDQKDRDPTWSGRRNETRYSFYDRSGHPDSQRVRGMLEGWASRFPDAKRNDIVSRIRSKDMDSFDQAFFEMFVHEFLLGTGATVIHEPEIGGSNPDFAISDVGFDYVVEATSLGIEDLKEDRNELQALDWLNAIDAPWFTVYVETYGVLDRMIPKRELLRPFEKLVEDADYEYLRGLALSNDKHKLEKAPSTNVTHGDWKITGTLMTTERARKEGEGFIGLGPTKSTSPDHIGIIRKALKRKAKQCAGAEKAIIAIELDDFLQFGKSDALFGTGIVDLHFNRETGKSIGTSGDRLKDGFWVDKEGPQHEHVIGIMFFHTVRPWKVKYAEALFVPNPYVTSPLPGWSQEIDHVDFSNGKWKQESGKPIAEFMKDYEDVQWPGAY